MPVRMMRGLKFPALFLERGTLGQFNLVISLWVSIASRFSGYSHDGIMILY
ncbi:MAG: hypothetical protein PHQ34_13695 [Methanothrix sp.]|nr:hypothetical protein [Methanothrix sp.]